MKKIIIFIITLLFCFTSCQINPNRYNVDKTKITYDSLAQIKLDSINRERHIRDSINRSNYVKQLIKINKFSISKPNSAGGVNVYFTCTNLNEKPIKYVQFQLIFENNVHDLVFCDIRGSHYPGCQIVGPINKLKSNGGCFENIIYNYSTRHAWISELNILYMDGSEEKLTLTDLKSIKNTKI